MTDRRTFLKTSSLGLATTTLLSGVRVVRAEANQEPRFKKAIKIGMARGETLLDKFRVIKECGFDGVDMDSPNDYSHAEVLNALSETGLEVHGCVCSTHWRFPLSHPDAEVRARTVSGMREALEDCKEYGGTTVLLVPAVVNEEISYDEAYERSQEEIRKLLPDAEQLEVTIAFENVWNNFLLSPLEFARYIDEFESEHVGAYFDIGNIPRYGWPEHWIRILGPRIVKLDIKEFSRKKMNEEGLAKGFDVKLGDGDIDWSAVRAALDDIGYEGYGTAEMPGGDAEYLKDLSARMDRCLGLE